MRCREPVHEGIGSGRTDPLELFSPLLGQNIFVVPDHLTMGLRFIRHGGAPLYALVSAFMEYYP